jgi:hypothetical protein
MADNDGDEGTGSSPKYIREGSIENSEVNITSTIH